MYIYTNNRANFQRGLNKDTNFNLVHYYMYLYIHIVLLVLSPWVLYVRVLLKIQMKALNPLGIQIM